MPKKTGHAAIVEVLESLRDDMAELAPGIVREIRSQVPEYDRVPLDDHTDHVQEQQERIIAAFIENRGLNEADLRRAAALGRLRAAQGVSVEGVISAYHVGNRELWRLIDERADRGREFLPDLAARMWEAIHVTSIELTAAHSLVARARHTQSLTMRHRFVELLDRIEADPELVDIATSLGFDVRGDFVAGYISAGQGSSSVAEALHEGLEALDGVSFAIQQSGLLLVVAQGPGVEPLRALVHDLDPGTRAGIGMERTGLSGARESIRDAAEALLLTRAESPVAAFGEQWWLAALLAQAARLEPALGPMHEVVVDNQHLVETVQAFAASGFSISSAAKKLHVHPNSVAYRLDRWASLTDWNPRTVHGLVHSLVACAANQGAHVLVEMPDRD